MRVLTTKIGTTSDAAPSGAPSALARSFTIAKTFGFTPPTRTSSLRGYFQALDGSQVHVTGVTCTAQLWFCDPDTNVWYTVGAPQTLTAESLFAFPFVSINANTATYLQLTGFANVGTTATVVVHGVEGGDITDTVSPGTALYTASAPTLTSGQLAQLRSDISGNLLVSLGTSIEGENSSDHVMMTSPKAISSTTGATTNYTSGSSLVGNTVPANTKATAGRLYRMYGVNTSTTALYYLVAVDKASAAAGGDAIVAAVELPAQSAIGGKADGERDFGSIGGKTFTNGISFAISTTLGTVTLPGAGVNTCWVEAEYA